MKTEVKVSKSWVKEYAYEIVLTAGNVFLHLFMYAVSHGFTTPATHGKTMSADDTPSHSSSTETHLPPPLLLYAYDCLLVECIFLQFLTMFRVRESIDASERTLSDEIVQLKADFSVLDDLERSREHEGPFIETKRKEILSDIQSLASGSATIRSISDVYAVDVNLIDDLESGENLLATVPSFDQLEINYLDVDFQSLFSSITRASLRGVSVKRLYFLERSYFEHIPVNDPDQDNLEVGSISLSIDDSQFYFFDTGKKRVGLVLYHSRTNSLVVVPGPDNLEPIGIISDPDDNRVPNRQFSASFPNAKTSWVISKGELIKTVRHFYTCVQCGMQVRWHFADSAADNYNNDYVLFGRKVVSTGSIRAGGIGSIGREFHATFSNSPVEISSFERKWSGLWDKARTGVIGLYCELSDLVDLKRKMLETSKSGIIGHVIAGNTGMLSKANSQIDSTLAQYASYVAQKIKEGFRFEQLYFIHESRYNDCHRHLQRLQQSKVTVVVVKTSSTPAILSISDKHNYPSWNCFLLGERWLLKCLISRFIATGEGNTEITNGSFAMVLLSSDDADAATYKKWFLGVDCWKHPDAKNFNQIPGE